MTSFHKIAFRFAIVACVSMQWPGGTVGRAHAESLPTMVHDVSLNAEGKLSGTVVDLHGVGQPNTPVAISQNGDILATATSDGEGRFAFAGLRGGNYVLSTAVGGQAVRVWSHGTAPPAAAAHLSLVSDSQVARGQLLGGGLMPIATLGIATTALVLAIVLPIALDDDAS